jgi:hypothetical protein
VRAFRISSEPSVIERGVAEVRSFDPGDFLVGTLLHGRTGIEQILGLRREAMQARTASRLAQGPPNRQLAGDRLLSRIRSRIVRCKGVLRGELDRWHRRRCTRI